MFLDVFMMENEVIKYGSILPVKLEIIGDTNLQLRVYQINLKLLNSAHSWQLKVTLSPIIAVDGFSMSTGG